MTRLIRQAGSPSSPVPPKHSPARAALPPACASIKSTGILLAPAERTAAEVVDELKRHGIPVVQLLRRVGGRARITEGGLAAVVQLFRDKSDASTAVVCHNDLCARSVMLGLPDLGLTPGRDAAVIGFDNIPEGAMHRPAMTTAAIGVRAHRAGSGSPVASPHEVARKLIRKHYLAAIRSSCGSRPPI